MRVCFLFYGPQFDAIAKTMIASVRKHMPDAIVTQLSDRVSRRVEGVDEIRRIDGKNYGYLLCKHMQDCPPPFIRLDYDMVIQGDLSHVLEGDHEYAFNLHGDPDILKTLYGQRNPIAGSVYAAKAHQFAVDLREAHLASGLDDWLGMAHSHNEVAKRHKVKLLDGRVYNYTPSAQDDKPEDVLVIHYKGARKHWMVTPEQRMRAREDERRLGSRIRAYGGLEALVRESGAQ